MSKAGKGQQALGITPLATSGGTPSALADSGTSSAGGGGGENPALPVERQPPPALEGRKGVALPEIKCPFCGKGDTCVANGTKRKTDGVHRSRKCNGCGWTFPTFTPWSGQDAGVERAT